MRALECTEQFKADYQRVRARAGKRKKALDHLLVSVVAMLVNGARLPETSKDRAVVGGWLGYRDCLLQPDLVLMYCCLEPHAVQLVRLGSHAELFG